MEEALSSDKCFYVSSCFAGISVTYALSPKTFFSIKSVLLIKMSPKIYWSFLLHHDLKKRSHSDLLPLITKARTAHVPAKQANPEVRPFSCRFCFPCLGNIPLWFFAICGTTVELARCVQLNLDCEMRIWFIFFEMRIWFNFGFVICSFHFTHIAHGVMVLVTTRIWQ